jgi:hypothetical protein
LYCEGMDTSTYMDVKDYEESLFVTPYSQPLPATIFSMTKQHPHVKIKPFHQRIRLAGPSKYQVRATAQIDNGAMRNCIGRHVWESYGHCLGTLILTTLKVSVANNQTIQCDGLWYGDVDIGGTKSKTYFVIFDCKGTFDVILGKPWLHEVKAVHDYATDTIIVKSGQTQVIVDNIENGKGPKPTTQQTHETDTTQGTVNEDTTSTNQEPTPTLEPDLDKLIDAEILRIEMIHKEISPFAETRWAKYLDIDEMDDEESPRRETSKEVEWFTTRAEQREIERAKRHERREDRKRRNKEVL